MAKLTFPSKKKGDCQMVTVPVDLEHPLLKLKAALPWQKLHDIAVSAWRKAGKNVDGGRGRSWDSWLCLRIVILTIVMGLQCRQMEQQLAENAVMRVFVECQDHQWPQVRDHSTIARIVESLDQEVYEMINDCVLHAGIPQARAIVKNKAGKQTEFGFKYLIGRIGGGYLFGKLFIGNVNEQSMPRHALQEYQRIFGSHTVPELVVYDRIQLSKTKEMAQPPCLRGEVYPCSELKPVYEGFDQAKHPPGGRSELKHILLEEKEGRR